MPTHPLTPSLTHPPSGAPPSCSHHAQLEKLVEKNYYLHQAAKEAFRCVVCVCARARALRSARCGGAAATRQQPPAARTCRTSAPPQLSAPPPTHTHTVRAHRSYLLAYNSHHLKDTFNVHTLDLRAVARSFGFATPPRVREGGGGAGGGGRGAGGACNSRAQAAAMFVRHRHPTRAPPQPPPTPPSPLVCCAPATTVLAALQVNINIESKAAHTRKAGKGGGAADYRRKTGHGFRWGGQEGRGMGGTRGELLLGCCRRCPLLLAQLSRAHAGLPPHAARPTPTASAQRATRGSLCVCEVAAAAWSVRAAAASIPAEASACMSRRQQHQQQPACVCA